MKIGVVGASGFIGAAVRIQLAADGHEVVSLECPRVQGESDPTRTDQIERLASKLAGLEALINCAGVADAVGSDAEELMAGNAFAAEAVAAACDRTQVQRLVHVSSAAVQGRTSILDSTDRTQEFSPYSRSKAEGERRVRARFKGAVIYRPPGVHDATRSVTKSLFRVASSSMASVAGTGERHTPQALLGNVAAAIGFLATVEASPPQVVSHPWEGLTTENLLRLLGGKSPRLVPWWIARMVVSFAFLVGRLSPTVVGNARRLEMLWFGQDQANSWLTTAGWVPPYGRDAWRELGETIRNQ